MSDRPAVFLRSKSRTLRRPKPVLVATIPCWIVVVAGRLLDVSVPVLRCQHHNSTSPPLTTLFAPSLHPPPRHLRGCEAATGVIIVCIICARRVSVNEVDCLLIQSPFLFLVLTQSVLTVPAAVVAGAVRIAVAIPLGRTCCPLLGGCCIGSAA